MAGYKTSRRLYAIAKRVMVGGVSSPVRAFQSVGGGPLFLDRGRGPWIWDVDGNRLLDYVCSWGALILGHANRRVAGRAARAVAAGSSFGAPTVPELMMAREIKKRMRSMEKVRFVNSGTEATMSAVRLARAYTKRAKVIKFDGCYHGHADQFLSGAGSGLATLGIPQSAGVLPGAVRDVVTLRYNDIEALDGAFGRMGNDIAAVIVEPVAGNMGVVPARRGFLEAARRLCTENGSLLIFDEVITGFRVGPHGAQGLYGIRPDITCLGKIIGGGFPVGAYGAGRRIMDLVAPNGPVYQAGTLSGNPVAMAAGLATLSLLDRSAYARLERQSGDLERGIADAAARSGVDMEVNRVGSMLGVFFTGRHVENFDDAKLTDPKLFRKFFWGMLRNGVYLPPSRFESMFVSTSHGEGQIGMTVDAAGRVMEGLR